MLGDEILQILHDPENRRALYAPANLRTRITDETHDLGLGGGRPPDVPGKRHTRLPRTHDGHPSPAPDLPQR